MKEKYKKKYKFNVKPDTKLKPNPCFRDFRLYHVCGVTLILQAMTAKIFLSTTRHYTVVLPLSKQVANL